MILPPPSRPHEPPPTLAAPRPQPGTNSLLASTPFGFVISGAPSGGASFAHPWMPSLVGKDGVRLAKGVVMSDGLAAGFEPVITEGGKEIPISGDAVKKLPQPTLRLASSVATEQLESWVCLEVTPAEDGKLADAKGAPLAGVKIEVVHRNAPTLTGKPTGRHPLALIVWSASGPARIWPITFFNLRYHRTSPAPGHGLAQHLFY
jgi:hypothetical protein